jgi:hypothetical protein
VTDERQGLAWCTALVQMSSDSGRTWKSSGRLDAPTAHTDLVARLLAYSCAATVTPPDRLVWRVSVWPVPDPGLVPEGDPEVVARSDGLNEAVEKSFPSKQE